MFLTKSTSKNKEGFTLVELLVVIAIITTLSSVVLANLIETRKKSRDTGRIQHVEQVRRGLELFFLENNRYPNVSDGINANGEFIGTGSNFDTAISGFLAVPNVDPLHDGINYYYRYVTENPGGECDPVVLIYEFETSTMKNQFNRKDATIGSAEITASDFNFCPDPNTHYN